MYAIRSYYVRHIQLPKLKHVLLIAVLLRFMDSFMIYTEAVAQLLGASAPEAVRAFAAALVAHDTTGTLEAIDRAARERNNFV